MELSPLLLICILQMFGTFLFYDEMIMSAQSFRYYNNMDELKYAVDTFHYFSIFFTLIYVLIADYLRYRPLIILCTILLLLKYVLFFFPSNAFSIHVWLLLQALSGRWLKAVLPYLYSIENKSNYQKITAYVEASEFTCIFFSDLWDEIYTSGKSQDGFVQQVPLYTNAIMLCIVLPCSYMLPPIDPKRTGNADGFENLLEVDTTDNADTTNEQPHILDNLRTGILHKWNHFKVAFTNHNVLKWSAWYSLTAYMSPLNSYYNLLLINQAPIAPFHVNSLTFTILYMIRTLLIISAFIFFSRRPTNWKTKGDQILCWCALVLLAITILQMFNLHQLFQIILMQIFQLIIQVFCVICVWEIAQIIPRNSYALVIGFDMLVTQVLDVVSPFPDNPPDFIETKIIFIHAILLALMGLGFGISAKKSSRGESEQRGVSLEGLSCEPTLNAFI